MTEEQLALKTGIMALYESGTGKAPQFDPEILVERRDGVVCVMAIRYLVSTVRAPLDSHQCEAFTGFANTFGGIILS